MSSGKAQPDLHEIEQQVMKAAGASRGHFVYESGHHGDLWLDLDQMWVDARRVRGWAIALAAQVANCRPELICGPLTGGAFIAQFLAAELGVGFCFAERLVSQRGSVEYRLPLAMRGVLSGQRLLVVDDAINAGSALKAALAELAEGGSLLVGIAALLSLGPAAAQIAAQHRVPLYVLANLSRGMWPAEECPLCAARTPLVDFFSGSKG